LVDAFSREHGKKRVKVLEREWVTDRGLKPNYGDIAWVMPWPKCGIAKKFNESQFGKRVRMVAVRIF